MAANDNQGAANDNEEAELEPMRETYEQPIQPQTRPMRRIEVDRSSTSRGVGTSAQIAGAGTQATGKAVALTGSALKGVGKGLNTGGDALIRAGAAASSTGVGAIVGVPTIALGAGVKVLGLGTQAAGSATKAAGRSTEAIGKGVKNTGGVMKKIDRVGVGRKLSGKPDSEAIDKALTLARRIPGPIGKVAKYGGGAVEVLLERKKVVRANIPIFSAGFSLWLSIQLPLAFLSLAFLGVAYVLNDVIPKAIEGGLKGAVGDTAGKVLFSIGGTILQYIGTAAEAVDGLFQQFFGFSLIAIGDPNNWFIATYFLVVIIGWSTLLIAVIIYTFFTVNPFFGKGWAWKIGGFLIALFGYIIPGLNIFPWFALYAGAALIKPE